MCVIYTLWPNKFICLDGCTSLKLDNNKFSVHARVWPNEHICLGGCSSLKHDNNNLIKSFVRGLGFWGKYLKVNPSRWSLIRGHSFWSHSVKVDLHHLECFKKNQIIICFPMHKFAWNRRLEKANYGLEWFSANKNWFAWVWTCLGHDPRFWFPICMPQTTTDLRNLLLLVVDFAAS